MIKQKLERKRNGKAEIEMSQANMYSILEYLYFEINLGEIIMHIEKLAFQAVIMFSYSIRIPGTSCRQSKRFQA